MIFQKDLIFVEQKDFTKNGNVYHVLKFKDETGAYIDSIFNYDLTQLPNLYAEEVYTCTFKYYKDVKTYRIYFNLMEVK